MQKVQMEYENQLIFTKLGIKRENQQYFKSGKINQYKATYQLLTT